MTTRRWIMAAVAAATLLSTAAQAEYYRPEYPRGGDRDWHRQEWRQREWREHQWREREAWGRRPYVVRPYAPPAFAFMPPSIVIAPRW